MKTRPENTLPLSLFNRLNFAVSFLTLLPSPFLKWRRWVGSGNCGQFITLYLCCSFVLMLFPCSSRGFVPLSTVLQELLQCGCFPWDAVLQEQTAPTCHRSSQKTSPFPCSWGQMSCQVPVPVWSLVAISLAE